MASELTYLNEAGVPTKTPDPWQQPFHTCAAVPAILTVKIDDFGNGPIDGLSFWITRGPTGYYGEKVACGNSVVSFRLYTSGNQLRSTLLIGGAGQDKQASIVQCEPFHVNFAYPHEAFGGTCGSPLNMFLRVDE